MRIIICSLLIINLYAKNPFRKASLNLIGIAQGKTKVALFKSGEEIIFLAQGEEIESCTLKEISDRFVVFEDNYGGSKKLILECY